jgi:hypothetical protein
MHSKVLAFIENQMHEKMRWKLGEVNYLDEHMGGISRFRS